MSGSFPTTPRLLASVLAFDNDAGTLRTLTCLREQTRRPDDVVVVDNGSREPFSERARDRGFELEPHEVVVRVDENLGVGRGHNIGLRAALDGGHDMVCLLEHDSFVLPGCLAEMVRLLTEADDPTSTAVHPRLARNRYEARQIATGQALSNGEQRPRTLLKGPGHDLTFNGLLLSTDLVRRLGPIREDLFVGFEDADYSRRLAALGGRLLVTADCLAIHPNVGLRRYPEPPSAVRRYFTVRNNLMLQREATGRAPVGSALRSVLALGRDVLRREPELARARARGIADGVRRRGSDVTEW